MRSVILTTLSKLRQHKKQNLLLGLSIMLSVLLLTTSIGVLLGINKPFDMMFDRLRASHILLYYDLRQNEAKEIKQWFEQQDEVAFVGPPQHFLMMTEPLSFKGEKVDIMFRITELGPQQDQFDQLQSMSGRGVVSPGPGEVLIPRHLSQKYQISIGDTLGVPLSGGLFPLVVSDIVVDPHYASGLINPNRLWIASGMLPFMVPVGELNQVMQGIRLHNKVDIGVLWDRFNSALAYNGSNLQYKLFKSVFTSLYKIIGMVIVLFSLLAIIISTYLISAVISNSLMADSRLNGSLRALGYTGRQVTGIYLLQYLALAAFAIPTGLIASLFIIRALLHSIMQSIGVVQFELPYLIIFGASTLFFLLLITLLILVFTRKAGKLKPAEALRSIAGDVHISRSRSGKWIPEDRIPLTLWIALKMIFDHPQKAVLSFISLMLTAFILGFSVNISNSFGKMAENRSQWGFDLSDLQVSRSTGVLLPLDHEDFKEQLLHNESIKVVQPFTYYELSTPAAIDRSPIRLMGKVFEGNPECIGLNNLEGRNPMGEGEVSLCMGTADELGLNVGDSVDLLIEHELLRLELTGIYQDISNMGEGFRLSTEALNSINPLFEPSTYALILQDEIDSEVVKKMLREKYGEAIHIEITMEEQLGFLGIAKSINASLILISLFFVAILIVSVFNEIFLSILEQRRSIGVYQLIGFSYSQLKVIMIWKTTLLSVLGTLFGWALVRYTGPLLMGGLTTGFGIAEFPMIFNGPGTLLVFFLLLILAVISTSWAALVIKRISPRMLVTE